MSPTAGIPGAVRPMPKEITSVAPLCRRYLQFIRAIAPRPTNAMEIIALLILSDASVASTRRRTFACEMPARRTVDDT